MNERDLTTVTSIKPSSKASRYINTNGFDVLSTPPSGHVYKIESIVASNIDATNDVDLTVWYMDYPVGSTSIATNVTVPAASTLIVTTADTPLYLNYNPNGNSIFAKASVANKIDIIISYQDITTSA